MKTEHLRFHGSLLRRGFWLYVCRVAYRRRHFVYVGRTGDSSSINAGSPFTRIGQHLNVKHNARNNMLVRHVRREGLNPEKCSYEVLALGPIYQNRLPRRGIATTET